MRARWWALSIVGILLAAAICTLVLARCRPYPWCKTTECIEDGTYCFDPVVECPTDPGKEALTEWTRWWCDGFGLVWDKSGWLCECY